MLLDHESVFSAEPSCLTTAHPPHQKRSGPVTVIIGSSLVSERIKIKLRTYMGMNSVLHWAWNERMQAQINDCKTHKSTQPVSMASAVYSGDIYSTKNVDPRPIRHQSPNFHYISPKNSSVSANPSQDSQKRYGCHFCVCMAVPYLHIPLHTGTFFLYFRK